MVENHTPSAQGHLGRASNFQGLTGVAAISLKGGGGCPRPRFPLDEDGIPVLMADPNAPAGRDGGDPRHACRNINRVVADNQEAVKNSLHNLETFTLVAGAPTPRRSTNVMLKVDGVMGKADSLMLGLNTLGRRQGRRRAVFLTVKSIRELAEDFDKRSRSADGRRAAARPLADISRAVNNLDRNPTTAVVRCG